MNPLSYFYTLRSYVDSYAGFLGARFLSLIWVVAICVVVWFYGHLLGYGDFKPLAGTAARLTVIGIVVAVWAIYLVVSIIRGRRRDKALAEGLEDDTAAEAAQRQQAEVGEIRDRLKEALALMRRVTRKRFGYVYELPWYVIFGAPGSGKTTALTNSGLKFPLGEAMGTKSVQGIGGTRNCNWWFAEDAILIDTAGRYTTQDDLDGASKAGWEGFLGLLKKYRRSQPINGALVTISIGDLLTRESEARLEEMRAIRQRLSELDEILQARVPVYVVLTKADLLTGFVDFFDGFNKSDREQVWGATFALDESYKAQDLPDRFVEEFALLQERVGSMLIERMQQEQDVEARGRIFRFPAELASLKERLHEILTELCSGSRLVEAPLLRGVYLASGTQAEEAMTGEAASRPRRSYFLSRLFSDVIFGEAALVARDRRLSRRQFVLRQVAYGLAAAVAIVVLASWTATYFRNFGALAQAEQRIDAYEDHARNIPIRDVADADFLRILPALDNLRNITAGFADKPVWQVSFGLDQENKIRSRQREAYQRALNGLLLPRMLYHLQARLAEAEDPARSFDDLKLYAMLGGMGPADPDFVAVQAQDIFAELYPGEGRAVTRRALAAHAESLASGPIQPIALDERLIADARAVIRERSVAARAYDILEDQRAARLLPAWVPAEALGPLGERAFVRASRASLREGMPGFFTARGYQTVVLPSLASAASEALSEEWVRGEQNPAGTTVDSVSRAAVQLYFDNFERRWRALATDMRPRSSQSLKDAAETVRMLGGNPAPLEAAAKSIAAATNLDPLGAAIPAANEAASLAAGLTPPDPFAGLREVVEAADGDAQAQGADEATPMAALQTSIAALHDRLSRAATSTAEVAQVFDADSQLVTANQDLLQQGRQLPAPLDTWVAGISADIASLAVKTARAQFNDLWSSQNAVCTNIVDGRYPFVRESSRDVAMSDFVRLFAPSGVFDRFFKERLEPFVDTTVSPWTWRGTFGAPGEPSEALAQFENADRIRRAFFREGSGSPAVTINIKPVSLSGGAEAVMMEIEGEKVVYTNNGRVQSKSVHWPSEESKNLSHLLFMPGGWDHAITENGDWSVFRLFDRAQISDEADDLFRASFRNAGLEAEFEVQFGSVLNPFRLTALADFRCPSQL
ncbi:type VI secretion system membrane subunit TssM [Nitratireductor sp. ZSWI3]|uniref:type VI secretion system membrane subunit TssM n=1 Tax=Nitratireductor sp. ZSWI3 TaxID=2966359 RepID=UPI00214FD2F8|nr:type VI secretion system membrane subunit TssM [Nitratireductor sp. ZSWI3]MCR4266307.1 type VI secretion system membrane subunit TssM [Nitratireductor sp. ZSWI3]